MRRHRRLSNRPSKPTSGSESSSTEAQATSLGVTDLVFEDTDPQMRASALDRTPWSNEFKWDVVQVLARHMNMYRVTERGVLFHEHAAEAFMCIVLEGRVKVVKETSDGEPKVLTEFGNGKVIGEMSLLDGRPRSATLVASTDVNVLIFAANDLNRMLARNPEVAFRLLQRIARDVSLRLRHTSGQLVDLMK